MDKQKAKAWKNELRNLVYYIRRLEESIDREIERDISNGDQMNLQKCECGEKDCFCDAKFCDKCRDEDNGD